VLFLAQPADLDGSAFAGVIDLQRGVLDLETFVEELLELPADGVAVAITRTRRPFTDGGCSKRPMAS
jgi:hypothetical protein